MSVLAGDRLPSPLAVTGVVSSIIPEPALVVRLSDSESGFARLCWRQAWQALRKSEESGWSAAEPTVWASTDKADKVASARAGDSAVLGQLKFTLLSDELAYLQLVGTPGLTALVMLDRESHRFLSVKFRNRR